jgi:hypothetical protein
MRWLVLLGFTGCVTYQPGSFSKGPALFAGERATIGCLDLAIERRDDYDKSAVLHYRFGNRCEHPQVVDLGAARVVGRDAEGGEHVLRPFDPRYQIHPTPIDARLAGGEAIAYVADDQLGVQLVQVCVDAASIVPGQPMKWMCFAKTYDPPADEVPEDLELVHEEAV